jgi:hypothetical protein
VGLDLANTFFSVRRLSPFSSFKCGSGQDPTKPMGGFLMANCRFSPKHKCLSWYRCCGLPTFKEDKKETASK